MVSEIPDTNLTMLSLVKEDGELDLSLARLPMPKPRAHEVVVKVLAAPINPSDLFLLLAGADMGSAKSLKRDGLPLILAPIPAAAMRGLGGRVGRVMPVGNEGCGIVVGAGTSVEAQALLGKPVAMLGGGMYADYRCVPAKICMQLLKGRILATVLRASSTR